MAREFSIKTTGLKELEAYFAGLEKATSLAAGATLSKVLNSMFEQTQQDIHVHSGRLRDSGRSFVTKSLRGGWEGTIAYGDSVTEYAMFERFRGGDHDFFRNIYFYYPAASAALQSAFVATKRAI